jgi:predicted dienelactone hydrolase
MLCFICSLTPFSPQGTQYLPYFSGEPAAKNSSLAASAGDNTFPVVVYSHGLGSNRASYSIVCYELASRGFVVAAIEHRYESKIYVHIKI